MTICAMGPPLLAMGVEQFIVLVLVGFGIALKNYFENKGKQTKPTDSFGGPKPPAPPPPPRPAAETRRSGPATSEEEKMRKFFEALGLPTDSMPPPMPVAPAKSPPPPPMPARPQAKPPAPPPILRVPLPGTPPPFGDFQAMDADKSPQVLAGDLHRVDPKFDHATLTADFRGASRLDVRSTDVHVDVRPDLIGVAPGVTTVGKVQRSGPVFQAAELARSLQHDRLAVERALVLSEILGKPLALRE